MSQCCKEKSVQTIVEKQDSCIADFLGGIAAIIAVLCIVSLPLSMLNLIGTDRKVSVCTTYGYYLPLTFIMCNMNGTR